MTRGQGANERGKLHRSRPWSHGTMRGAAWFQCGSAAPRGNPRPHQPRSAVHDAPGVPAPAGVPGRLSHGLLNMGNSWPTAPESGSADGTIPIRTGFLTRMISIRLKPKSRTKACVSSMGSTPSRPGPRRVDPEKKLAGTTEPGIALPIARMRSATLRQDQ